MADLLLLVSVGKKCSPIFLVLLWSQHRVRDYKSEPWPALKETRDDQTVDTEWWCERFQRRASGELSRGNFGILRDEREWDICRLQASAGTFLKHSAHIRDFATHGSQFNGYIL